LRRLIGRRLRAQLINERWAEIAPPDQSDHLRQCGDCVQSLLQFLEIRGWVDYRAQPCFHVAYYSADVPDRCMDRHFGLLDLDKKERRSIHCHWFLPLVWHDAADSAAVTKGATGVAPPFRPLGRRSGRIPAEPYPPPRSRQHNRSKVHFAKYFVAAMCGYGL